ncbi:MAG: hypothetical protein KAR06_01845 [Deltaproteobacteria bacterium]|nr:hypothetical protein [Deltaproteobacteria bacterium]
MSSLATIEEKVLGAVNGLGKFKKVSSAGRKEISKAKSYPASSVFFVRALPVGKKPRPSEELLFNVVVINKNVKSEKDAARDTYTLLEDVRDVILGKRFSLTDIEGFDLKGIKLVGYISGVITYVLEFTTVRYLPVPTE